MRGGENPPFTLLSTRNWGADMEVETIARALLVQRDTRPEPRLGMLGTARQAGCCADLAGSSRTDG